MRWWSGIGINFEGKYTMMTLVWFIFGFCLNHEWECFMCYKALVDYKLSYIEPFILLYSLLLGNWFATHYTLAMVTHFNSQIFTHWWSSRSSCVPFSTIFSFCNEILDLACFAAMSQIWGSQMKSVFLFINGKAFSNLILFLEWSWMKF